MNIQAHRLRRQPLPAIGLWVLATLTGALSACGGSGDARYSVGGSINGLTSPGLVVALGLDMVGPAPGASSFTFATPLPRGATYSVSIQTQPDGQTCSVGAGTGSGTVGAADVTSIVINCLSHWIWESGSSTEGASGSYGSQQGVASAGISPGARDSAASWTDSSGNFWLFGGGVYEASGTKDALSDLWEYSPGTGLWTWQGGSTGVDAAGTYGTQGTAAAANSPGARYGAAVWTDSSGNFWLFGGYGYDSAGNESDLSDLWEYAPATGEWTWVGGSSTVVTTSTYGAQGTGSSSNLPGARSYAAAWTDSSGNLWLFGGDGYDSTGTAGALNDLWKYSPATGQWTWVGGSDTAGAAGVYAAGTGNVPGARYDAVSWTDSSGNVWLFGGYGDDSAGSAGELNDLWEYTPVAGGAGVWNFVSGAETEGASGVYGTEGTAAAANVPGARENAVGWIDSAGDLWLMSGYGLDSTTTAGYLNDLWEFSPSTGQWTWMSGADTANAAGVYGTLATDGFGTAPGARVAAADFTDSSGNFWVFGGYGYDSAGAEGNLNDLWQYTQ